MNHYHVVHAAPAGRLIESIVHNAPGPMVACVRAAEWALAAALDVLPGELTLVSVRQISDREAWAPVTDERARHG